MKNGLYLSNGYLADMLVIDERLTDLENMLDSVLDRLSKLEVEMLEKNKIKREPVENFHIA